MGASAGWRDRGPPLSGRLGAAGSHLTHLAADVRFKGVRETDATVVVTAIALAAVTVTAAVALTPQLHLGYPREAVDLCLDTAASVIGLLACFLVFGRLRRRTQVNELLLAGALAILTLSNLFLCTVPDAAGWAPDVLTVWMAPVANSLGALLFALAAFCPGRRPVSPGPLHIAGAAAVMTALLATMFLVPPLARATSLQAAAMTPGSSARPGLPMPGSGPQLAGAVLYGVAVVGFLRSSRRRRDEFGGWLAVAATLAAASQVNYLLSGVEPQSRYGGDAFRCFFYAVLFVGSVREVWSYWQALSKAAVLAERRRIACELHDGVAQELAYLARNLESLGGEADEDGLDRMRRAVERARLESRRVISAAATTGSLAFEVVLAEAVTEVAERHRVELDLDLAAGIRLPAARREASVRIACEAVANAARHSGAGRVHVRLERDGPGARLRVSDQGRGFDPADPAGGFGLASMLERARSVGAELVVSSAPGHGSRVELTL
jgi:signal transduction histidine kinase